MNVFNFFSTPDAGIDWMAAHPRLLRALSKGTLVGEVLGLYHNTAAFNLVQEEGFLGFTPAQRILDLAEQAGVEDGCRLLDVGSGQGGPLCVLGTRYRIHGEGLDLLPHNVDHANRLAKARMISERIRFRQGNALALPYPDASFDFVFGSDAWCHVPTREKLLAEAYRVLKPGGKILFFDWLDRGSLCETFRFVYAFPPLETFESYRYGLQQAGFEIECTDQDPQRVFSAHVAAIQQRMMQHRRMFIDQCGRETYDNWAIVIQYTRRMIDQGRLGHGVFLARKPGLS
jgi:ubiquinone/menaquinone biosynthesis C-methylase UbiE